MKKQSMKAAFLANCFMMAHLSYFLNPEDGGDMFFRTVNLLSGGLRGAT
jgi:hypothetical protein